MHFIQIPFNWNSAEEAKTWFCRKWFLIFMITYRYNTIIYNWLRVILHFSASYWWNKLRIKHFYLQYYSAVFHSVNQNNTVIFVNKNNIRLLVFAWFSSRTISNGMKYISFNFENTVSSFRCQSCSIQNKKTLLG